MLVNNGMGWDRMGWTGVGVGRDGDRDADAGMGWDAMRCGARCEVC